MSDVRDSAASSDRGTAAAVLAGGVLVLVGVLAVAGCGDKSTDPLVSIAIGPAPLDVVDAGSTVQLTATGTNRDGTTNDITATVAWSSSNELVASVDGSGVLSPHQPGTVTITAASKSLTTTHAVCVQGIARLEIGTPMDAPAGYLDNPVAVTAGSGQVLVAYGINDGTVWPPVRSLVTRRSSASSLPSWTLEDTGIQDSWQTSAPGRPARREYRGRGRDGLPEDGG